jgi:hypothetical protein
VGYVTWRVSKEVRKAGGGVIADVFFRERPAL